MSSAISIRLPNEVMGLVRQAASENSRSLNAELVKVVTSHYVSPVVLYYVKVERWGELDLNADGLYECPDCSEVIPVYEALAPMTSAGPVVPICEGCAT